MGWEFGSTLNWTRLLEAIGTVGDTIRAFAESGYNLFASNVDEGDFHDALNAALGVGAYLLAAPQKAVRGWAAAADLTATTDLYSCHPSFGGLYLEIPK